MILVHDLQLHFSNFSPGHRSESNPHSPADRCRWGSPVPSSTPWSRPIHPRPQCSQWRFFSHPGAAVPRSRCPCWICRFFHRTSYSCPFCLTALLQWSVVLSYDKVWDVFRWKQGIHSVFRRKQKIRTLLLSEKSSDFVVVVHLQGLEPWAHWLRVSCSTNWARGAYCRDAVSNIPTFESATTYFHAPFPANYLGHEWA